MSLCFQERKLLEDISKVMKGFQEIQRFMS